MKERIGPLVALVFLAVAVRLVAATWLHPLSWDEVEFFRATDWVRQGHVPYRDFWEHHSPLQWFVFAPLSALTSSPGAGAVVFMRWMQVPLWIVTFWLANLWMRNAGIARLARWMAIVLAVSSSLLMIAAIEYRVDVLGCALYLGGLVLLQRRPFLAGVAFCLTGWANLRLGPLLALTVLLNRVMDRRERKWRGTKEADWVFAGVIVAFAAVVGYFAVTGALRDLYRQLWVENYLGDRYAEYIPWAFLHRILVPFGIRIYGSETGFEWIGIDLAGSAIMVLGFIGMGRALLRWRQPDDWFFLAFLQVSNLIFIAAMKYVYHYHFEIVTMLMLPFVAREIERRVRVEWRRTALAVLVLVSLLSAAIVIFRGKEHDFAYQDLIMREAHNHTAPGSKVFDGVGWALRREPAYRYWFLPELVRRLVQHGHAQEYSVADWMRDPPAAVITDRNAALWLALHPRLGLFVVRHYLPLWRNLWLPGLSVRLDARQPTIEWWVVADGTYRILAGADLADHAWFERPLAYRVADKAALDARQPRLSATLMWWHNGQPAQPVNGAFTLRRGDRLRVASPDRVGVFLIRDGDPVWFLNPPEGVTLDSEAARVTHIPDWQTIFSGSIPTSWARP